MQRIKSQKGTAGLSETDRLELARLLVKAGYTVRVGREKPTKSAAYDHYVEYSESSKDGEN